MDGQRLKEDNKLQTRKDETQEEVLKNKISRLRAALELEKDPNLKKEILLLLEEYEASYKALIQKKRFLKYLLFAAAAIAIIIAVLFFMFLKDSSRSSTSSSQVHHFRESTASSEKDKTEKTTAAESSDKKKSKSTNLNAFPRTLLGTWSGYLSYAQEDMSMTFTEDNIVKTTVGSNTYTSRIDSLEKVGTNTYLYHLSPNSEPTALAPGAQIGGARIKYAYGIYLGEDYIVPIVWQASENADFDYSKPLENNQPDYRLTKGNASQNSSKATRKKDSQVDTKNLTTQQVEDWVIAHYLDSNKDNRFTKADFIIESWKAQTDGLVYAIVRENHDTDAMKEAGADPNVNPAVAHYRINANGELEKLSGADNWTVVSRTYYTD
ncbi:hypothetical protein [Streptococcus devriesei]|uniref:hypothetical protein n=1 Tax=Streptococcus devriesei TaxID=231233 RepID=UPI0004037BF0|nr:hypothetical protein [Streptococcus devriesei]